MTGMTEKYNKTMLKAVAVAAAAQRSTDLH
jgi:hypothetical protein